MCTLISKPNFDITEADNFKKRRNNHRSDKTNTNFSKWMFFTHRNIINLILDDQDQTNKVCIIKLRQRPEIYKIQYFTFINIFHYTNKEKFYRVNNTAFCYV